MTTKICAFETAKMNMIEPRSLPPYYVLESSFSARFPKGQLLSEVLARMERCMFRYNLQISDIQDGNKLHLISIEQLPLIACFWQKKDSSIVVEIQSNVTNNLNFVKYSKGILACLTSEQATDGNSPTSTGLYHQESPSDLLKVETLLHHQNNSIPSFEHETIGILTWINSFFMDHSTIIQGLENLCIMTDPSKVGVEVSLASSRVILLDSVINNTTPKLADSVLRCLAEKQQSATATQCKLMALSVIVNAVETVVRFSGYDGNENGIGNSNNMASKVNYEYHNNLLSNFVWHAREILEIDLVDILIDIVQKTLEDNPHPAYLAVRALTCFCAYTDGSVRNKIVAADSSVLAAIQLFLDAHHVGLMQVHFLLQSACYQFLNVLHSNRSASIGNNAEAGAFGYAAE